jgi:hypothetical protein
VRASFPACVLGYNSRSKRVLDARVLRESCGRSRAAAPRSGLGCGEAAHDEDFEANHGRHAQTPRHAVALNAMVAIHVRCSSRRRRLSLAAHGKRVTRAARGYSAGGRPLQLLPIPGSYGTKRNWMKAGAFKEEQVE